MCAYSVAWWCNNFPLRSHTKPHTPGTPNHKHKRTVRSPLLAMSLYAARGLSSLQRRSLAGWLRASLRSRTPRTSSTPHPITTRPAICRTPSTALPTPHRCMRALAACSAYLLDQSRKHRGLASRVIAALASVIRVSSSEGSSPRHMSPASIERISVSLPASDSATASPSAFSSSSISYPSLDVSPVSVSHIRSHFLGSTAALVLTGEMAVLSGVIGVGSRSLVTGVRRASCSQGEHTGSSPH